MYEGVVYRPPSEGKSLIIQVTIGCSHNKCTFCSMYKDKKFRVRKIDDVLSELEMLRKQYRHIEKIFLADGNALVIGTKDLLAILSKIKLVFPECKRVGVYGAPKDILRKSEEELKLLKNMGLGILYLGVESGSDKVLNQINKGVTSREMIESGKRVVKSGIKLSTMIISGLGGKDNWKEHSLESAKVINAIQPDYISLLTLLNEEGTEMSKLIESGEMKLLNPEEVLKETRMFVENLQLGNCMFRSNHASNYLSLAGNMPEDKINIIEEIDRVIESNYGIKEERFRSL